MYKIGVTGVGSLIGQGIIKSITRSQYASEYTIIGFDYFKDTVGSFWCHKNYILPDILKEELREIWLDTIIQIINDEKIQILFIGIDFELPVLAKNKIFIESKTSCKVMVSGSNVIEIGNDKFKTYEFLKNNGLNYPQTFIPDECDWSKIVYPVIVKPRIGARSIGVTKVNSEAELQRALDLAKEPIIQECIGDETTEYTCGVISLNKKAEQIIVLNRSLKQGNTYLSEYKNNFPEIIYDYLKDITALLQPYGSTNYQLRMDHQGIPKLFEINPRHSGTTYMRTLFGFNEVIYILKNILEDKTISFDLKEGKAMRFYDEALVS